jgi:hypothetical protein
MRWRDSSAQQQIPQAAPALYRQRCGDAGIFRARVAFGACATVMIARPVCSHDTLVDRRNRISRDVERDEMIRYHESRRVLQTGIKSCWRYSRSHADKYAQARLHRRGHMTLHFAGLKHSLSRLNAVEVTGL